MKTNTKTKPTKAAAAASLKKPAKCIAKEVGHRACNCGGPDCGANVGGR